MEERKESEIIYRKSIRPTVNGTRAIAAKQSEIYDDLWMINEKLDEILRHLKEANQKKDA